MLTPRQDELLRFIEQSIAERCICPSFEEMRLHLGVGSKSTVARLVDALVERGFIRRLGGEGLIHRRALEVIKPQTYLNPDYERGYRDGAAALEGPAGIGSDAHQTSDQLVD